MKQNIFIKATLAVAMAVFSSTAAMGQQQSDTKTDKTIDWMKEITSRVTFNGYAQGGYSYSDAGGKTTTDFNLKRTLLWAKARITDRWSFLFMHDFSSVVPRYEQQCDDCPTRTIQAFLHHGEPVVSHHARTSRRLLAGCSLSCW